ncbi:MAG: DUF2442 domain-containing protein [Pseudomonadota bacterium]
MAKSLSGLPRFNEVRMILDVVAVKPGGNYLLELEFKNGERRRFDMKPLLSLKPWNRVANPAVFSRVRVDYGTVVWPGEIDVAPETLYDDSVPIKPVNLLTVF